MSSTTDQEPTASVERPTLEPIFTSTEHIDSLSVEISENLSKTQHAKSIGTTTPEVEGEEQEPAAAVEEYPTTPISAVDPKSESLLRLTETLEPKTEEPPLPPQPKETDEVGDTPKEVKGTALPELSPLENEQLETPQESQPEATAPPTGVRDEEKQLAIEEEKPLEVTPAESEPSNIEKRSEPTVSNDERSPEGSRLEQVEDKVSDKEFTTPRDDEEPSVFNTSEEVGSRASTSDNEKPESVPELKLEVSEPTVIENQESLEGEKLSSEALDGTPEPVSEDIKSLDLDNEPQVAPEAPANENLGTGGASGEAFESKHSDAALNEISGDLTTDQPSEDDSAVKTESTVVESVEESRTDEVITSADDLPALETAAKVPEPQQTDISEVEAVKEVLPELIENNIEETPTLIPTIEAPGISESAEVKEDEPAAAGTPEAIAEVETRLVEPVTTHTEAASTTKEAPDIEEEKFGVEKELVVEEEPIVEEAPVVEKAIEVDAAPEPVSDVKVDELAVVVNPGIITAEETVGAEKGPTTEDNTVIKETYGSNPEAEVEEAEVADPQSTAIAGIPAEVAATEGVQTSKEVPETDETSVAGITIPDVEVLTITETPVVEGVSEVEEAPLAHEATVTEEALAEEASLVGAPVIERELIAEDIGEADETLTAGKEPISEEISTTEDTPVAENETSVGEESSTHELRTIEEDLIIDQEPAQEVPAAGAAIIEETPVFEVLPAAEEAVAADEIEEEPKQSEPTEESVSPSDLKEAVVAEPVFDSSTAGETETPVVEESQTEKASVEQSPDDVEQTNIPATDKEATTTAYAEDTEGESSNMPKELESAEIVRGEPAIEDVEIIAEPSAEEATPEQLPTVEPVVSTEESSVEKEEVHGLKAEPPLEGLATMAGASVAEGELESGMVSQPIEETLIVEDEPVIEEKLDVEGVSAAGETLAPENAPVVEESIVNEEVPTVEQELIAEEEPTTKDTVTFEEKPVEDKIVLPTVEVPPIEQNDTEEKVATEESEPLEPTEGAVSLSEPREEVTEGSEIEKELVEAKVANEPEVEMEPAAFEIQEGAQEEATLEVNVVEDVTGAEAALDIQGSEKPTEAAVVPEVLAEEPEEASDSKSPAKIREVPAEERLEVPEVIVELTAENQPSHGDDLGPNATLGQQEAFEKRKEDAEPDKIFIVEEPTTPEVVPAEEKTAEPTTAEPGDEVTAEARQMELSGEVEEVEDKGLVGDEGKIEATSAVVEPSNEDEDDAVIINHDDAKPEDVAEAEAAMRDSGLIGSEGLGDVPTVARVVSDGVEAEAETIEPSMSPEGNEVATVEVPAETQPDVLDIERSEENASTVDQEEVKDVSTEAIFDESIAEDLSREVSISPFPASETYNNPIDLVPGEEVSNPSALSIDSNVRLDQESYEKADASNLGTQPEVKAEQEFSISPLPASRTATNPIDLQPGEPIPELGVESTGSTVKLDAESYEKADASNFGVEADATEEQSGQFSVKPLPAFETASNPIDLAPGEPVPRVGSSSIESNAKLDEESYERADASNFGIKPEEELEEFSVNPLPASEIATNPIDFQLGVLVPVIGSTSDESNVELDEESYEKADSSNFGAQSEGATEAETGEFSVKPLPASETAANPINLQPGELVPEIGSVSVESNVKLDEESYNKADASNLGVDHSALIAEQVFSVNPLPASEAATNPIDLQPGEPVPAIGSTSAESNVKLDEESYEEADASNFGAKSPAAVEETAEEAQVFINPFPASQTAGNPIELQPGEPIPGDQLNSESIDANVKLDEESYEKADASNFGVSLPSNTSIHSVTKDAEPVHESTESAELSPNTFNVDGAAKDVEDTTEIIEESMAIPEIDAPSAIASDASKPSDVTIEKHPEEATEEVESEESFTPVKIKVEPGLEEHVEETAKEVESEESSTPVEVKVEPGLFVDKSTGEIIAPIDSDSAVPIIAASVLGGAAVISGAAAAIARSSKDKTSLEDIDHKTHTKPDEDAEEQTKPKQADEEFIAEPAPQTAPSPVHGKVIQEADVEQVVEEANTSEAPAIVVTSPTVEESPEAGERTVELIEPTPEDEGSTQKVVERESENTPEGVRRRMLAGAIPGSRPVSSGNDTVSTKHQKNVMRAFWNVLFFGWLGGFGRIFTGMFGKSKKGQRAVS